MSYPEKYDIKYKRWSLDTLPFLPREFKYEVIPGVQKQFNIVKGLLNRPDVETIYVCTDSGREGEYIYRLVAQMAGVKDKEQRRVWIDSQTEEEILRGIREAKELSVYDNLADSAYLRAKEDYLMGINFSRVLTLRYGNNVSNYLNSKYQAISVGRVMTCVLDVYKRQITMLSAMGFWNEYPLALVLLTDDAKKTLPIGMANLFEVQKYATDWGALFAGLVIIMIPTMIIYLIGQRYLLQGIGAGGLKG